LFQLILVEFILAEPSKAADAQPSDREEYRRAPEGGDKKGDAGAGSFEFVRIFFLFIFNLI
jgi:hypothetical protein